MQDTLLILRYTVELDDCLTRNTYNNNLNDVRRILLKNLHQ